jgi:TatD DNase family protein
MLFDTHAHYDDKRFIDDLDGVLQRVFNSDVSYILNAASSPDSIDSSIALAEKYERIYAAVGVHPHNAGEMNNEILDKIKDRLSHPKVVALGEIGLDYHYNFFPKEIQIEWLIKQIEVAIGLKYPVIIHNRESSEDMINIVKKTGIKEIGGVFHCFSGSLEMAKILLDNNFYLSFGGPITFNNAKKILDVLKYIPMNRILIETDSPYLTPEPYRGKRNDSSMVALVAKKIGEIKNIPYDEVAHTTTLNAISLFNLKK